MSTVDDLDGRIGEGWGGEAPNGCHVNVVLARRGSPTAAAAIGMLAHPTPGHTPVLVCVGATQQEYEPVWPPTLMMNKATALDARHQAMTWGAAQLGIGQGVLDAVADGLIEASGDLLVLVAVWVDADADDETALRVASRTATRKALGTCVEGRDPAAAAALVEQRDALRNPFYGGRRCASPPSRRARTATRSSRRSAPRGTPSPGCTRTRRSSSSAPTTVWRDTRAATQLPDRDILDRLLLGVDPRRADVVQGICETVDFHHGRNWTLEVAVWDLVARSVDLPLWQLLGGETRQACRLRVDGRARLGRRACAPLPGVARRRRARGQDSPSLERLAHRSSRHRVVRDAVGSDLDIMVDANQGWRMPGDLTPRWDLPTAAAFAQELHRLDVYWLEEPLPTSDVDEYATLCRSSDVRIAAGEMVRSAAEARALVLHGGVDVVQTDVVLSGGIEGCRHLAALADEQRRTWSPHTWSNGYGLLANLHAALAFSTCPYVEVPFDPPAWSAERRDWLLPVTTEIAADGTISPPHGTRSGRRPGLGSPRAVPDRLMRVRAVVLHEPGRPVEIAEVELDPPKAGEVLVRVAAAGVCHSDVRLADGELGPGGGRWCSATRARASSRPSETASPTSRPETRSASASSLPAGSASNVAPAASPLCPRG